MNNTNHPATNRIGRRISHRALAKCAALVGACLLAAGLQAQTNDNFNTGTNAGWENWLPDEFIDGGDTNLGNILPAVTMVTNPVSAGNYAVKLESGVVLGATGYNPLANSARVGTYFTNGAPLANFTMTGEFFNWTNSQSEIIGIAGRVRLPLPPVNQPGEVNSTPNVSSYVLAFVNRRAHQAWGADMGIRTLGGSDEMRFLDTGVPVAANPLNELQQMGNNGRFNGREQSTPGLSYTPDSTNGHYRLIFTASGTQFAGQIVDLSTGLPMTFTGPLGITNMIRPDPVGWPITNTIAGSYGFLCNLGSSPTLPSAGGSGIWATYDNFAIVPGVVTLESAATVEGPYAQDTSAGIEVYPKRITVPVNGNARFYRINWIGGSHTPTITSITPGGSVNVVTGGPITNVVSTMLLTYQ